MEEEEGCGRGRGRSKGVEKVEEEVRVWKRKKLKGVEEEEVRVWKRKRKK